MSQNFSTTLKFVHRHKLSGPMRLANITRPDNHRFAPKRLHLRRFCSECHCAGFITRRLLQKLDQRRVRRSLKSSILPARVNHTLKIRIGVHLFRYCRLEKV